jgi:hypothetical protein
MGHGAWMRIAWGNMEDGWMRPKHSSQNVTCFDGICFKGSSCLNIKMHARLLVETWHVSMGGRFRGSCFVVRDFWIVVTSTGPPSKHDMFLCWFPSRPMLPMHGNSRQATLKQTTHLQLVIEITSGHQKMCSLKWLQNCLNHIRWNSQILKLFWWIITPNVTLNISFVAPCAMCTTMGSSTSLILTLKNFVVYRIMKDFVGHEFKGQQTPLSLIYNLPLINWRFRTWHLPWKMFIKEWNDVLKYIRNIIVQIHQNYQYQFKSRILNKILNTKYTTHIFI